MSEPTDAPKCAGLYCELAASEIPGFGTNRDKHRCAKLHRDKPPPYIKPDWSTAPTLGEQVIAAGTPTPKCGTCHGTTLAKCRIPEHARCGGHGACPDCSNGIEAKPQGMFPALCGDVPASKFGSPCGRIRGHLGSCSNGSGWTWTRLSNGIEAVKGMPKANVTEDAKESGRFLCVNAFGCQRDTICQEQCLERVGTPTGRTPARFLCVNMFGCQREQVCEHRCLEYHPAPTPGSTTGGDVYETSRPINGMKCIECGLRWEPTGGPGGQQIPSCPLCSLRTELAEANRTSSRHYTALAAALKREGEAGALAKERHDTANMLFEADREARERADVLEKALERIAKWDTVGAVYHKHGDGIENCTAPQCIARRALAPVPTAEAAKEPT
jgi:hypothetical protein